MRKFTISYKTNAPFKEFPLLYQLHIQTLSIPPLTKQRNRGARERAEDAGGVGLGPAGGKLKKK